MGTAASFVREQHSLISGELLGSCSRCRAPAPGWPCGVAGRSCSSPSPGAAAAGKLFSCVLLLRAVPPLLELCLRRGGIAGYRRTGNWPVRTWFSRAFTSHCCKESSQQLQSHTRGLLKFCLWLQIVRGLSTSSHRAMSDCYRRHDIFMCSPWLGSVENFPLLSLLLTHVQFVVQISALTSNQYI